MLKFRFRKKTIYPIIAFLVIAAVVFVNLSRDDGLIPEDRAKAASWYGEGWSFRKKITIDNTKVDSDLTDFPVLIKYDQEGDLKAYAQLDGDDILFTSGDGITKLSHEIEAYNSSTGELVAWVKTNLSDLADTEIYMYYGNELATSQENVTDVWSAGYESVWHLNESSGDSLDSTANNISGVLSAGITQNNPGKIGSDYTFNGSAYINYGNSEALPEATSPRTMCVWGKTNSVAAGYRWMSAYGSAANNQAMFIGMTGTTLQGGGYGTGNDLTYSNFWSVGVWKHTCLTYDGTQASLYGDGSLLTGPTAKSWSLVRDKTYIGRQVNALSEFWNGEVDEVRISSVSRSAEWISTEYNNQNSPSTFYITYGADARSTSWYDTDWNHRKQITIDHTKVSAVLTDFPVLVNLTTDADLATYAQNDGDDIVFTTSDGSTKLSHEIEKFNGDTGELIAWVKIPSLSNVTDTEIYLYYENPDATNQENITDVWSNGYTGVWHLRETKSGSAGDFKDSTSGDHDSLNTANQPNVSASKIGNGQQFARASSQYINAGDGSASFNSGDFAMSIWVNNYSNGYRFLAWGNNGPAMWVNAGTNFSLVHGGTIDYSSGYNPGSSLRHLVISRSGSTLKLYSNGSQVGQNLNFNTAYSAAGNIGIGANYGGSYPDYVTALLDEVRLSASRSAEWIATEYNNQNSPSTFLSLESAEELDPNPPTNPTIFKTYSSSAKTLEFTSDGWINSTAPYFEWSGATDDISGVDGYYLYLGTSDTANPEETSGIIEADNSPHYTTSTNFTLSEDMTEGETYYFRIKTKDNADNVSAATTTFTYSLDSQAPDPPEYINVSPVGCSTTNDFTFSWLAATDNGASNVAGYQYKKGSTGEIQSISGLELSETAYQDSDNVLYLRSIDNAGNTSSWQTAVYCTVEAASLTSGPDVVAHPSSLQINWRSSKETTSHVEVYDGNTYLSEFGLNSYSTEHAITVLGLKAERSYRYRLSWKDSGGNISYSNWYETVTAKAPQVENLEVKSISATSMLVSFSTNYSATAVLQYGKNSYDQAVQFDNLASYFSTVIEKLDQGTDYKLRVVANTNDGTEFAAGESFSTPPLPSVSTLNFRTITDKSAVAVEVSWTTNIETTSSLFYRQGSDSFKEVSSSEKTLNHKLEIGNLEDNTIYDIYVTGTDQYGNQTRSATRQYTTPEDTRPPTITDIVIETSNVGIGKEDKAQAAISYSTDEPAKCLIEYAEGISGDNYSNKTPNDETMSNSHLSIISDLKPQTPYHFRIICSDKANNQSESSDQTVISGEITPSVFNIILKTLNDLFGWLGRVI